MASSSVSGSSSGPVVVVTGGSRGIGAAIARRVAKAGGTVAVVFRSRRDEADKVVAELPSTAANGLQQQHAAFQADVSDPAACEKLIEEIVQRYGRIHALVNNAGILEDYSINTKEYADFAAGNAHQMNANAASAANLSWLVARHMATVAADENDGGCRGRIVNISSRSAYQGSAVAVTTYAASKAAMGLLGQNLARTFGPRGIAFFGVAPTYVLTDMVQAKWESVKDAVLEQHPIGRIPTADEVARAAQWLAMEAPLPMTGTVVDVNGASHVHH